MKNQKTVNDIGASKTPENIEKIWLKLIGCSGNMGEMVETAFKTQQDKATALEIVNNFAKRLANDRSEREEDEQLIEFNE